MTATPVYRKDRGEGTTRVERGIRLFEDGAFERISRVPEVWVVEGPNGHVRDVNLTDGDCSCPDFDFHRHVEHFRCKHIIAATLKAAWLKKTARVIAPVFGEVS